MNKLEKGLFHLSKAIEEFDKVRLSTTPLRVYRDNVESHLKYNTKLSDKLDYLRNTKEILEDSYKMFKFSRSKKMLEVIEMLKEEIKFWEEVRDEQYKD